MIVHLFEDEKFVDTSIEKFEEIAAGENRYIVLSNSKVLTHPKRIDKIEILPNNWRKLDLELIFKNCELLVFHYLSPIKVYILKNKPKKIDVVWIVWGRDAYDYLTDFQQYEPLTSRLFRFSFRTKLMKTFVYDLYYYIKYGARSIDKEEQAVLNINYVATVIPTEYELIKKRLKLKSDYVKFNYDSLTTVFSENRSIILGQNIIIGNSATPSNNHLDIFHILDKKESLIFAPLNYGDLSYGRMVERRGIKKYGNHFNALNEFLPFSEYQDIVISCNTMIMYHIRQQALGNILLALYIGIRVFLNNKSTIYKYFKSIGMIIFDFEKERNLVGVELSSINKKVNREVVIQYWGNKKILEGTTNIVNLHKNKIR